MGRIDEAMRRSGLGQQAAAPSPATPDGDTFVSPWSFRDTASMPVADRPPVPVAAPEAAGEPRPAAHFNPLAAALAEPAAQSLQGMRFHTGWVPRLVTSPNADHVLVEQFRQLAATLHQAQTANGVRVILTTSAEPSEGKSLTSINLALTLSESYKRSVLLIDADLRRPSLHDIAQVSNVSGLGETLKATGDYKLPIYRLSENLMLAPAGRPDPNPMGALTSPRMREMLAEAVTRFDWVLLDAPPIGPIADSSLLAPLSDATLLVVRAGRTHHASVQKAVDVIGRDHVLGVVLNDATLTPSMSRRYYYAYGADTARQE